MSRRSFGERLRWRDTPQGYGLVSRCLHWAVAYLLVWQFVTLLGWRFLGDGPVMRTVSMFGPYHGTVGVLVLAALLPRAVWAIGNRHRRPPHDAPAGRLTGAAHGVLYMLMLIVPGLALVRAYGSGKGYAMWGLQIVPETGFERPWLSVPADWLHAPLAWTLAVLIAGHVAMALVHQFVLRDRTLSRMAGRLPG